MAELVHCQTCGGLISTNATVCPHCGETEFFQDIVERREVTCPDCNGQGVEWKVADTSDWHCGCAFAYDEALVYPKNRFRVKDAEGRDCWVSVTAEEGTQLFIELMWAFEDGSYIIEGDPDSGASGTWAKIHYTNYSKCPRCKGEGTVMGDVIVETRDLRGK